MSRRRSQIATLCESIISDPEAALRRPPAVEGTERSPSLMQKLLKYCVAEDAGSSALAMVSTTAVFIDVLPSYRIREVTSAERQQAQTKEVYKLRQHESALLGAYTAFLKILGGAMSSDPSSTAVAVRCLGQLLVEKPRFNLTDQVLRLVAPKLDSNDARVRDQAVRAVREAIERDSRRGDAAVAAVKAVAKVVKDCGGRLRTDGPLRAIETLEVRACDNEELVEKRVAAEEMAKAQKRRKPVKKRKASALTSAEIKAAERSMREADAAPDPVEVERNQRDVVHHATLIYARVLRAALSGYNNYKHTVLAAACRGLRSVAKAMNADVLADTVKLLIASSNEINGRDDDGGVSRRRRLSTASRLECAATTLSLMNEGYREALQVDDGQVADTIYDSIFGEDVDAKTLVSCVEKICDDKVGGGGGGGGSLRAAAFGRRLLQVAAHAPHGQDGALASLARFVAQEQLFELVDDEYEPPPVGVGGAPNEYDPLNKSSKAAAALALPAFELLPLAKHFDPAVRRHALSILNHDQHSKPADRPLMLLAATHLERREGAYPADPPDPSTQQHRQKKTTKTRHKKKRPRHIEV